MHVNLVVDYSRSSLTYINKLDDISKRNRSNMQTKANQDIQSVSKSKCNYQNAYHDACSISFKIDDLFVTMRNNEIIDFKTLTCLAPLSLY